ncbi:hypothetical protein MTR_4g035890 [Medicago truncatula]|uniref:Uncharacterized protein n=1 Tax=Medicago truncatula TaxID=3880 RepID=A0A072UI23_MEDTR|nr:hypothetical protein MTR_4g035890 [Medicago truncatula]
MRKMGNICFLRAVRVLGVGSGWDFGPQFSRCGLILPLVLILWKHGNNKVWNNIVETTQQIGDQAVAFLNSWKTAQETRIHNSPEIPHFDIRKWSKPSVGRFKCNVDTSFSASLNKVGFGACIRDANGNHVISRTECFTPLLDVEMGEAT